MTYNSIGYLSFFVIMSYVIGAIGHQFYTNGKFYLETIFKADLHLVDSMNKLLLVCYYLFNLGYIALSIQDWVIIQSLPELIDIIAEKSGSIILLLGLMHYLNLWWLSHYYQIKSLLKSNINV